MTQAYGRAKQVYDGLKKEYLENRMHPNHFDLLKAGKKYFKDDSFELIIPKKVKEEE